MRDCPWGFLRDGKKHIISLVGGGGKTTIMYELADFFAARGKRTAATTTTHIWRPAANYAADMEQVRALWRQGRYAVVGEEEAGSGKLVAPQENFWAALLACAEIILIEADGARHMPCKLPAAHEPVLLPQCDIVIGVAGLDALGRTLEEACLRWQLGSELFASGCNVLLDERRLAALLLSEQGTRKAVGERGYYVALNKCDAADAAQAQRVRELLLAAGMPPERIWLRGRETGCDDANGI
ncbi:MAG: selenium cofactor biosynthesis protein YqeC [Phascolarctobacterium sp.]|uniref:selenium cofactor biosynthesis protein YqeC n=1 Tax=Phascolarctobacterium sp. TaxID=2049039 RepID=UPI0026DD43CB|nr:selenium cofactor biosynthesis protein YqeC [Phascolarctobacterium sp.]MDO4921547.1 selenium cofactor biosynthesis protein YqeC [Phascolarctobacterium sp.]